MTVIAREDGVQFTLLNYRETLSGMSVGDMRAKVKELATGHGKNCAIVPLREKTYEAVFTDDEGFPLGECVWHHFGKPINLILCETINHEVGDTLLVVIREGTVYLDEILPRDEVAAELSGLLGMEVAYEIHVFGDDVPLVEEAAPEQFAFPKHFVSTYNVLPVSQINTMVPPPEYQLLSPDKALVAAGIQLVNPLIAVGVAAVLVIAGYFLFFAKEEEKKVVVKKVEKIVDPYEAFRRDLSTPKANAYFYEMVDTLDSAFLVQGWVPTKLDLKKRKVTLEMIPIPGSTVQPSYDRVIAFAKSKGASYKMRPGKVTIEYSPKLKNRKSPTQIQNREEAMLDLVDKVNSVTVTSKNSFKDAKSYGKYEKSTVNFSFEQFSGGELYVVGNIMDELPVDLKTVQLSVKEQGLYDIKLSIDVFGY